jgi:hypothetical protein
VIDPVWIKPYGLIKARQSGGGDGNLPLYTALTLGLASDTGRLWPEYNEWSERIAAAFAAHEIAPGLVRRTPTDTGQETWDNLLGWTSLSLIVSRPEIARRIVKHALTHAFCFPTTGKITKESFILLPHLWALAIPAAFPFLRPLFRPLLRFIAGKLNADHPGGIILDWVWLYSAHLMGVTTQLDARTKQLPAALADQFDANHPAIGFAKELA